MEAFIFLLVTGSFSGFIGWLIAKGKGRGAAGFWWGFFLGFVGWIVAACLEPSAEIQAQRMAMQAEIMKEAMKEE